MAGIDGIGANDRFAGMESNVEANLLAAEFDKSLENARQPTERDATMVLAQATATNSQASFFRGPEVRPGTATLPSDIGARLAPVRPAAPQPQFQMPSWLRGLGPVAGGLLINEGLQAFAGPAPVNSLDLMLNNGPEHDLRFAVFGGANAGENGSRAYFYTEQSGIREVLDVPVQRTKQGLVFDPVALERAYGSPLTENALAPLTQEDIDGLNEADRRELYAFASKISASADDGPQLVPISPANAEEAELVLSMRASGARPEQIIAALDSLRTERIEAPKPQGPLRIGEVMTYGEFKTRSISNDKLSGDHQPSRAAVVGRIEMELDEPLTPEEADWVRENTGIVVVTGQGHVDLSETFGGRNNPERIAADAADLKAAADSNFDAMVPDLQAHGLSNGEIEAVRHDLHRLNEVVITRINERFGTDIRY